MEDLSLEFLEQSEGGIVDVTDDTSSRQAQKVVVPKDNTTEEDDDLLNNDFLDVEDLANLGDEASDDDEDTEKNTNTADKTKNSGGSGEQKNLSSQGKTYTLLASALAEAGVFSTLENEDIEKIGNVEDLMQAIAKEIKNNELKDLNEDQKNYIEAIRTGVPYDEYAKVQTVLTQYKSITDEQIESNVNLQFELIKRSLVADGVSEERAKKLAKASIDSDDAVEEAIQAKAALIENGETKLTSIKEQAQAKQTAKLEKEKEELGKLKSKIYETSEVLPGIKINTQTKDKIFNSLTSPVNVDGDKVLNEVMDNYKKDPDYKIKLHALHVITNGFKDFNKIAATNKTKVVNQLEAIIENQGTTKTGGSGSVKTMGSTSKSIFDAIQQIEFK